MLYEVITHPLTRYEQALEDPSAKLIRMDFLYRKVDREKIVEAFAEGIRNNSPRIGTGATFVCMGRSLLRSDLPTVADIFAANGYTTGHFGKWHLGDNYSYNFV